MNDEKYYDDMGKLFGWERIDGYGHAGMISFKKNIFCTEGIFSARINWWPHTGTITLQYRGENFAKDSMSDAFEFLMPIEEIDKINETGFPHTIDDPVNSPKHYTQHPSGVECIQITRHMGFNLGNVMKYVWRADLKNGLEDLEKALWYLQDEIKKRSENEKK